MADSQWQAVPLFWGHGPRIFEMFLEPSCPFSAKALFKLKPLLAAVGEDKATIKVRLNPQPWHLHTGTITRCVIAASTLDNGRDAAYAVLETIGKFPQEFVCENHATGPNRKASPDDIIARIEHHTGLDLTAAFAIPNLDSEIKWHCRYSRQNGIHSTPTFIVNGVIDPKLSSGDSVETWAAAILNSQPR